MKEINQTKSTKKTALFLGSLAFTLLGFALLPSLLHIYQTKVYKASLSKTKIDFDHLGPEIIHKSN